MMANNNDVVRDPTTGNGEFLVEVTAYVDGVDLYLRPEFAAVRVKVEDERGTVRMLTVPHLSGAFRGVDVENLAERLGTSVDCILTV